MELELGFQANCSELVTYLGITDKDKILQALADIAGLTGWNWWANIGWEYFPIRTGDIRKVVKLDKCLEINIPKMRELYGAEFDKVFKDPPRHDEHGRLCLGKERTFSDFGEHRPYLELTARWWYGESLYFIQEAVAQASFPAFHAIRMAYNSDFVTEDGGSPYYYLEWLSYHFYGKEATFGRVTNPSAQEDVEQTVMVLERLPPIDRTKGLTEKDRLKVLEFQR